MAVKSFIKLAPGGQSTNEYLNVFHVFNASLNVTSVAAYDSYFPAFLSVLFQQKIYIRETWGNVRLERKQLKVTIALAY